jgi:hypothetical protein
MFREIYNLKKSIIIFWSPHVYEGCHTLVAGWSNNAALSVNIKTAHTLKEGVAVGTQLLTTSHRQH